jgi:predicted ABC-type transport system involved in lysophospholipase L1 biosynthesis ATPase subunit
MLDITNDNYSTGIFTPDAGKVEVLGLKISALLPTSLVRFRRERIGIVLQQFYLLPALTAVENVAVALLAQGCASTTAGIPSNGVRGAQPPMYYTSKISDKKFNI